MRYARRAIGRLYHEIDFIFVRIRGVYWRSRLQHLGKNTRFYGPVWIGRPDLVSIGDECTLNRDILINGRGAVAIGSRVRIAARVIINTEQFDYVSREHRSEPVTIKDGAWIGMGALIHPGVAIGEGAAVGGGSVVLQDVPPYTLVFGNPARAMRAIPRAEEKNLEASETAKS